MDDAKEMTFYDIAKDVVLLHMSFWIYNMRDQICLLVGTEYLFLGLVALITSIACTTAHCLDSVAFLAFLLIYGYSNGLLQNIVSLLLVKNGKLHIDNDSSESEEPEENEDCCHLYFSALCRRTEIVDGDSYSESDNDDETDNNDETEAEDNDTPEDESLQHDFTILSQSTIAQIQ